MEDRRQVTNQEFGTGSALSRAANCRGGDQRISWETLPASDECMS